nr:FAD-dependent oxidoreductase [Burkholderia sp. WSM2232]
MSQNRIAVIGGGIVGCMTAHRLLEADPTCHVTLVDRSLVGSGASRFSAGVHFPVGRSSHVRKMSVESADYYSALVRSDSELPIYAVNFFVAAASKDALEVMQRCIGLEEHSVRQDVDVKVVSIPDGFKVWRMPGCQVANVSALVQMLAQRLRRRISILESVNVDAIHERRDGVQIQLSTGKNLQADKAVLCPGPWANAGVFRDYTKPLEIRSKKVVALHLDGSPDMAVPILFPIDDVFMVPFPYRGHWLFSYTCNQWNVSPDDSRSCVLTNAEMAEAQQWLDRYAGPLGRNVCAGRVFVDAYSPSGEPIIAPVGVTGNLVFAGAANGSGYRLAPAIAMEAVRAVFE